MQCHLGNAPALGRVVSQAILHHVRGVVRMVERVTAMLCLGYVCSHKKSTTVATMRRNISSAW